MLIRRTQLGTGLATGAVLLVGTLALATLQMESQGPFDRFVAVHDFGELTAGEKHEHTFTIANPTDQVLLLRSLLVNGEELQADWSADQIAAQASWTLAVTIDSTHLLDGNVLNTASIHAVHGLGREARHVTLSFVVHGSIVGSEVDAADASTSPLVLWRDGKRDAAVEAMRAWLQTPQPDRSPTHWLPVISEVGYAASSPDVRRLVDEQSMRDSRTIRELVTVMIARAEAVSNAGDHAAAEARLDEVRQLGRLHLDERKTYFVVLVGGGIELMALSSLDAVLAAQADRAEDRVAVAERIATIRDSVEVAQQITTLRESLEQMRREANRSTRSSQ